MGIQSNHQTNNTIYDRKHRFMFILRELTALKNQIDHEVLNDGLSKFRALEIQDIYTRIIVGLIEEGVAYEYIENATDSKNDVIRLHIDGSTYECRNIDIREILEDRYEEVMSERYKGPSFKNIQNNKRHNKEADKETKLNDSLLNAKDVTNLLLGIKDAIHENSKQNIENSNLNKNDTQNNDIKESKNTEYVKKEDMHNIVNEIKETIKETSITDNQNKTPTIIIDTSEDTSFSKKHKNKIISKIINIGITAIVIGVIIAIINFTPGLKNALKNKTDEVINKFRIEQQVSTEIFEDSETDIPIEE